MLLFDYLSSVLDKDTLSFLVYTLTCEVVNGSVLVCCGSHVDIVDAVCTTCWSECDVIEVDTTACA